MLITWDDIFKFDDLTPLNNATAAVEKLEQTITRFVDTATSKIGQYAQETQTLKDEAQKMLDVGADALEALAKKKQEEMLSKSGGQ